MSDHDVKPTHTNIYICVSAWCGGFKEQLGQACLVGIYIGILPLMNIFTFCHL